MITSLNVTYWIAAFVVGVWIGPQSPGTLAITFAAITAVYLVAYFKW